MNTKKFILSILAVFAISASAFAWDYKFEIYDAEGQPIPNGTEISFKIIATPPTADLPFLYQVVQKAKTFNNLLLIENGVATNDCKLSEPEYLNSKYNNWAEMKADIGDAFNLIIGIDPLGGKNFTIEGKKLAKVERVIDYVGNMPLSNLKVVVENPTQNTFNYTLLGKTYSELESEVLKVPAYSPIYFSGSFAKSTENIYSVEITLNDVAVPMCVDYANKNSLRIDLKELGDAIKGAEGMGGSMEYIDIPFGKENGQITSGFIQKWDMVNLPGVAIDHLSFENMLIGPFPLQDKVNVLKIVIKSNIN